MKCSVDVSISCRDGQLTFIAGGNGPAYCHLTADVAGDPYDQDDFVVIAVYMESDYTSARDQLDGQPERDARALLEADERWVRWARYQVQLRRAA